MTKLLLHTHFRVRKINFYSRRLFHKSRITSGELNTFHRLKGSKKLILNLDETHLTSFPDSWSQSNTFIRLLRKCTFMIILFSSRYFVLDTIRKSYLWFSVFHYHSWLHVNCSSSSTFKLHCFFFLSYLR